MRTNQLDLLVICSIASSFHQINEIISVKRLNEMAVKHTDSKDGQATLKNVLFINTVFKINSNNLVTDLNKTQCF